MARLDGECEFCGQKSFMPYRCRYCNGRFCPDHRLPENHECEGLKSLRERPKWRDYSAQIRRREAASRPKLWERWDEEEDFAHWTGPRWPLLAPRKRRVGPNEVEAMRRFFIGVLFCVLLAALILRLLVIKR